MPLGTWLISIHSLTLGVVASDRGSGLPAATRKGAQMDRIIRRGLTRGATPPQR